MKEGLAISKDWQGIAGLLAEELRSLRLGPACHHGCIWLEDKGKEALDLFYFAKRASTLEELRLLQSMVEYAEAVGQYQELPENPEGPPW